MLSFILALSAPTQAAEVQVALSVPITVLVDGVPQALPEGSNLITVGDLPAGKHVVETRTLMGKTSAYKEISLAADDQIRFEYRQKELWHIGTYKLAGAPPPVQSETVQQTTVVQTGIPLGVGVTVTDGTDTVSVGSGLYGGSVVVSDGRETVRMSAGVQVTETTTTTTTVVHGAPPPPPPQPAVLPMSGRSFDALVGQMDNASFGDDKLEILRTAAANNAFTCAQLARILDVFSHGSEKLEAVAIVQPSIVDPENAFVINDRFSFSSDAQKAQAYFR
ncbi:MAG: DUF4476 domain-containing protein [Myxococcota bacterium]